MNKKTITYITLCLAMVVALAGMLRARDYPLVKAVVKPEKATVGSLLEYRITIAGKGVSEKDIAILLPEERTFYPEKKQEPGAENKADDEPDPADAVPQYIIHNAKKDNRSDSVMLDITVILELSFYRTGSYAMPMIDIKYRNDEKIGYQVPVVTIEELNQQGAFEEIEPPLDLGGNYTRLLLLIAGVVVLTLLIVFLVRWFMKRREERLNAVVPIPPIEIFLSDIKKLNAPKLIKEERVDDYVFGISMIFRKYLSGQLKIDATEMTTDEIDGLLKKVMGPALYNKYHDVMMQSFHLWDLSKFAEFAPSKEILDANLEKTERLARSLSEELTRDTD